MADRPPCEAGGVASPLLIAAAGRKARTLSGLRAALDRGRAYLAFQPVVDCADPRTVLFHEALFRIRDEAGHEVPAREFMPAAESEEIGREVDRTALALALRELAAAPGLRLSVNISARTVGDPGWMSRLRRAAARRPDVGARLTVEMTESSAPLLPGLVLDVLAELRTFGVRIALDDFGTGHSSIGHLQDYRFDVLKIDGRFARGIEVDGDGRALLAPMLGLARHFGMLAVVEQVETAAQAEALRAMGAGGLQGYLYGRPTGCPAWRRDARPPLQRASAARASASAAGQVRGAGALAAPRP